MKGKILEYRNIFGRKVKVQNNEEGGVIVVSTLPQTGEEGNIYYDTTTKKYYTYDSTNGFEPISKSIIDIISDAQPMTSEEATAEFGFTIPGSAYSIEPNKLYLLGTVQGCLAISPAEESDTEALQYMCRFTAMLPTPNGYPLIIKDATVPDNTIEIEEGHTYELNILHGVAMLADITSTPANNG